ncbi:Putative AMP-dependent synthetase/ligase, AMP-binding, ANL domain-containing protein [Septoria linicola]|uniref:AMP-dependent synthetase/ligase, AMP-binding, ANL domain-containing protein n=1 Tax=Septoria linicola TaxID=215465 RepID=A0A9Q9EMY3_9PEZI|nr:putative AMP-dependent synthetase/ligase, AMP-binding, ANL domain-containing protein [Septoria linicola]USW56520.1 Putative AMP-dependent synthetase/ligase, AMP-binding, ANL domain-containing protein [Septoria linicola]
MPLSEYHNASSFEPKHMWSIFEAQASQSAHLPAIIQLGKGSEDKDAVGTPESTSLTYADLCDAAVQMASEFQSRDVQRGDRIAVILPNRIEFLIILWATFRLGAILVPISPDLLDAPDELKHILGISEPKIIITNKEDSAVAAGGLVTDQWITSNNGDSHVRNGIFIFDTIKNEYQSFPPWPEFLENVERAQNDHRHLELSVDDDALLMFTSGSTSLPKGCLHTHRSYATGCQGFATIRHMQQGKSRLVAHRPLFHAFALCYAIAFTISGAAIVLPAFDDASPATTIDAIESAKCTHMAAIPSMMHSIAGYPSLPAQGFESLESIDLGGDLVTPAVVRLCQSELGAKFVSASHGMTETVGLLGHDNHQLDQAPVKADAIAMPVGKPVPSMTARICRPETTEVAERGEEGELHVSGPVLFRKYLGGSGEECYQDEQNRRWLITGDQAVMDEHGIVTVIGRYKDIIIRDGACISPSRIGAAIEKLENVDKAIVVAVEDNISGQLPIAVIDDPTRQVLPDQVTRHVAKLLGKEQEPHRVLSLRSDLEMKTWPQNTAGKPDKKKLQKAVKQFLDAQD